MGSYTQILSVQSLLNTIYSVSRQGPPPPPHTHLEKKNLDSSYEMDLDFCVILKAEILESYWIFGVKHMV